MPFTPESVARAKSLICPHATEPYDHLIDLSCGSGSPVFAAEKRFNVIWPDHDHWSIDPVIEMLIPLRKPYRKKFDLHIGIDAITQESHDGILVFRFNYGPNQRSNVDPRILASEMDMVAPLILNDLNDLFQTWAEADNGLCVYLEQNNISSIFRFLESIGLRKSEEERPSKEERRKAYLKAHPEHARTARPHHKK